MLFLATRIGALAVGVTLAILNTAIIILIIIIETATFIVSLNGIYIGNHFCRLFGNKMELASGMVMIVIGTKILIDHTLA